MDRIAVSGTVDAGSIPAWSATFAPPWPYLGPPRCACAEIVRQGGALLVVVIISKKKAGPQWIGLVFLYGLVLVCFLEDEIKFLAACHVHFVVYG